MPAAAKRKMADEKTNRHGGVRTRGREQRGSFAPYHDMHNGMLKTSVTSIDAHRAGTAAVMPLEIRKRPERAAAVKKKEGRDLAAPAALPFSKRYYDFYLLIGVLMIFTIGLLMVYSSSQYTAVMSGEAHDYYFKKQLTVGIIGLFGIVICSLFSGPILRLLRFMAVPAYFIALALAFVTLISGMSSHGSSRWLSIGGVSLQTAEVVKIALIIYMANIISKKGFSIGRFKNGRNLWLMLALPIGLIFLENWSSSIIIFGICFAMFFVGCRSWKAFIILGVLGLAAILGAKPLTQWIVDELRITNIDGLQYQLRRIVAWACPDRFPDDAYQTLQGLYAIGSGGLTGQGLGESIQKFGALPEAQNDMIFTIICEELGFLGACAVVLIYVFIILRLVDIARSAKDLFGSMLCVGIMAHISLQVILNIAVVTGVIPNTGVTLPFISYGGSAVLFTMGEIGIALAVSHEIPA